MRNLCGVPGTLSVLRLMRSWLDKLLLILKCFLKAGCCLIVCFQFVDGGYDAVIYVIYLRIEHKYMYRGLVIWWEFEHITARTVDNAIEGKRK